MSDGARGFFGIGIERSKTEHNVGTLWRTADLLGAAFIFTVGRRYKPRQANSSHESGICSGKPNRFFASHAARRSVWMIRAPDERPLPRSRGEALSTNVS